MVVYGGVCGDFSCRGYRYSWLFVGRSHAFVLLPPPPTAAAAADRVLRRYEAVVTATVDDCASVCYEANESCAVFSFDDATSVRRLF